ncbi:MAG: hypothetical protein ACTHN5_12010 [Phycisphaerae bacterium]
MPTPIPYEPLPQAIRYETDPDGALHIFIPPQPTGLAGRNRVSWAVAFLTPPTLLIIANCIYPGLVTLESSAAAASCLGIVMFAAAALVDRKFTLSIWIDATPTHLTVRRRRGTSVSVRTYAREALRAIDVIHKRLDNDIPDEWRVRLLGRYEWEILFNHLSRADSEQIANRLRTALQL